ncbi:MAG: cytochrome c3 family protein [Vicinamibacterales bacterium]
MAPSGLLTAAAALLATTTWVTASRGPQAPSPPAAVPSTAPTSAPSDAAGYVGSAACESCHQEAYAKWKASLHIQMTRPVGDATILGDFSAGAAFSAHGRAYTFARRDGVPQVTMRAGDRPPETYRVDYTLGSKRFQGYLSTLPDGRMYVLPIFWHVESGRWLDWKETTPIPDGAHDMKQIWNVNCFNCHATNLDRGYAPAAKAYRTHWTELGIGCEACHGPGRDHIALTEGWAKAPASMPRYSSRASNRQLSDILKIFSPRSADPRRTFDSCAYCHGNKRNLFTTFAAGDRYEDHALPFLLSEPLPEFDAQGEFWPDGRPNRFNRPQALTLSGCFKAGAVTCTSCHVAHGSGFDFSLKVNVHQGREGDRLCTQCHQSPPAEPIAGATPIAAGTRPRISSRPADGPDSRIPWTDAQLTAHSFHGADSAGSRCVGCHMSDVNWRLLMRRRDHTFQPPVPETTAAFGVPNACTTCHDDKTPEWAARQMDAWWGDTERRQKSTRLATTMYQAGSGDASAVPALAGVAVDRTQGAVLRASALEYIGALAGNRVLDGGPSATQTSTSRASVAAASSGPRQALESRVLGALLGAASDPEPMVRAAAVRTLGSLEQRDERILAVLMARVVDDARVVRARAAEALLALDVVTAPGRAGEALAGAQHDLAESLRSFPESAVQQTTLAWLLAQRGDAEGAEAAVRAALALDERAARPHVIRGVLAARAGRFDDALASWRTARELNPATPNIDRMIEEAQRRVTPPRGR